jgi:O-methyltransferase involved in polyketide biosynthesis
MDEEFFKLNPAVLHNKVSRALIFPVYSIAKESGKSRSLLKDTKATEIAGIVEHLFCPGIKCMDDPDHYRFILMKLGFDMLIKDYIWRHPSGTVVSLGCGLDTSYERLSNASVRWYDLDNPEIIGVRKLFIEETENRKFVSTSFLTGDWFEKIRFDDSLLIFASGVMSYYSENTVRRFLSKLSLAFPTFELVFDVFSPAGIRRENRMLRKKGSIKGPFMNWGLDDHRTLLDWNPRMKFLGRHFLSDRFSFRIPLRYFIPVLISDVLSMHCILHFKVRYDYRKLQS